MGVWSTKARHYLRLKQQDPCCNPISDWRHIAQWAYDYYRRIGISMYKWDVPKEYPKLYANAPRIEKYLYDDGVAVAWMNGDQFMITQCAKYGIDEYSEPDRYEPIIYGAGGIKILGLPVLTLDDCVPIWNNEDLLPTWNIIEPWVTRYAKTQAVRDNNLMYQNYPLVIKTKDGKILESKIAGDVLKDLHQMVIQANSENPLDDLDVLNLGVPYILDKLKVERDTYANDILQCLGVNTVEQIKKERLITDEAEANNEKQELLKGVPFELRKRACEQIKNMFGVEISVSKRDVEFTRGDLTGEPGNEILREKGTNN